MRDWHLNDRLVRAAQGLKGAGKPKQLQKDFAALVERLTPLREFRNHVAHGILCVEANTPPSGPNLVLIQPKDFYNPSVHERRKIDFSELLDAISALNALNDDFERLAGTVCDGCRDLKK